MSTGSRRSASSLEERTGSWWPGLNERDCESRWLRQISCWSKGWNLGVKGSLEEPLLEPRSPCAQQACQECLGILPGNSKVCSLSLCDEKPEVIEPDQVQRRLSSLADFVVVYQFLENNFQFLRYCTDPNLSGRVNLLPGEWTGLEQRPNTGYLS